MNVTTTVRVSIGPGLPIGQGSTINAACLDLASHLGMMPVSSYCAALNASFDRHITATPQESTQLVIFANALLMKLSNIAKGLGPMSDEARLLRRLDCHRKVNP